MNDISRKWERWFHTCVTLIAYILCIDQWIFLIFETNFKKTTIFCSANGYCQILVSFGATLSQNFDNFFLGHTVCAWLHAHENFIRIMRMKLGLTPLFMSSSCVFMPMNMHELDMNRASSYYDLGHKKREIWTKISQFHVARENLLCFQHGHGINMPQNH